MTALWVLGALSLAVPLIPFRYLAVAGQLPWLAGALLRYLPAAVCAGLGGLWLWQRRGETLGSTAVLDDAEARGCARTLGVGAIGSLGVILAARRKGVIGSAVEPLTALRSAGLYIDEELLRDVLRLIGEG